MILCFHDEGGESETSFMNSLLFYKKAGQGAAFAFEIIKYCKSDDKTAKKREFYNNFP